MVVGTNVGLQKIIRHFAESTDEAQYLVLWYNETFAILGKSLFASNFQGNVGCFRSAYSWVKSKDLKQIILR